MDAAAAAQSKVRKFQIADTGRGRGRGQHGRGPEADQRCIDQRLPERHQPAERVGPDLRTRQQEVGDRVQDAVRQVEAVEQACQKRLALGLLLRVSKGFGRSRRRDGTVGRLHDRLQRRHKLLLCRFEWREVVGERGTDAVIGRRGRDRRCVQQRQGGCVGLGDFEVVGAGGSPSEGGLLHFAVQQVDVSIAGLGCLALQG